MGFYMDLCLVNRRHSSHATLLLFNAKSFKKHISLPQNTCPTLSPCYTCLSCPFASRAPASARGEQGTPHADRTAGQRRAEAAGAVDRAVDVDKLGRAEGNGIFREASTPVVAPPVFVRHLVLNRGSRS